MIEKFFGEWVSYNPEDENERQEAERYLQLWKKFFLRKLNSQLISCEIIDSYQVERSAQIVSSLAQNATLGLKICVKSDFRKTLKDKFDEISNHDLEKIGI